MKMLTIKETAEKMDVPVASIRRLIRYDLIPYARLSAKMIRIHPKNIDKVKEALCRPRKRSKRIPLSEIEDYKVPESCPAPEDKDPRNRIYFIRSGPFVKIGFSTNTKYRMTHLQIANPYELELMFKIEGDKLIESYIQMVLRKSHHRGEWFHLSDPVCEFLLALENGTPIDEARKLYEARIMRVGDGTTREHMRADDDLAVAVTTGDNT